MIKKLLFAIVMLLGVATAHGQVENRALKLDNGRVQCGILPEMNGIHSYTVQLWFKPVSWKSGATLIERGDMSVALGSASGKLKVTVNDTENEVQSADIAAGKWAQLTLINSKGRVKLRLNNSEVASFRVNDTGASMDAELTLGGGYTGLIDEVRIWNKALTDEFDYFWNNTLNEFNEQVDNLLVYYKMDHEEWTQSLVDYKSLWAPSKTNHHGTITNGEFVGVDRRSADKTHLNERLPYLLSGAYTFTPRLYTAAIPRETYLLSNDIICLFIEMGQDGHLRASLGNDWQPNYTNTATLSGGAEWKSSVNGRKGVVKFDGADGTCMTSPGTTLNNAGNYTIEGWIKVDSWVKGATILRKGDFSIKLGLRSSQEIVISVGDQQFVFDTKLNASGWHYLGISTTGAGYNVVCDDQVLNAKQAGSTVTLPQPNAEVVWGEGLKATLDDWAIWNKSIDADGMLAHKDGYPMPVLGGKVNQGLLNGANTLYHFDNKDYVGLDHYSLEGLKAMMEEAYDGYRGYQFRVAVRASTSEFAWDKTITNGEYRQNFAKDLAYLVGTYDGAEYDLEWVYYDQWATFGDLIHECRQALPAGKSLVCSVHNVTWKFIPTNRIAELDGVTVQQYGPQKNNSTYSNCVSNYNSIKNRYPKEKICLSWASITSSGSSGGAARGVNWGACGSDYVPSNDMDAWNVDGQSFYFMSPIQVYRRAKLCQDEANMGIFYWEMAHDYRVNQKYCMARYASYGLNPNVDRIVTKATPANPTATGTAAADPDQATPTVIELQGNRVTSEATLQDGAYIAFMAADQSFSGKAWIGDGERFNYSEDAEWAPSTSIFRLDDAGNGLFYLYNMSTRKYVGHATGKSSRGDFYEIAWCDDSDDSRVSRMAIKMVNATGSLYLPATAAYMFNIDDKNYTNADKYSSLKVGDTEANFGYLGTNSWKVWLLYSFDEKTVGGAGLIDGVQAPLSTPDSQLSTPYDLQGRRTSPARPGLYIINGRKVVVK